MSTYSLSDGLASGAPRLSRAPLLAWVRESGVGVLASVAWIAFGLSCLASACDVTPMTPLFHP